MLLLSSLVSSVLVSSSVVDLNRWRRFDVGQPALQPMQSRSRMLKKDLAIKHESTS